MSKELVERAQRLLKNTDAPYYKEQSKSVISLLIEEIEPKPKEPDKSEMLNCELGLYIIHWIDGGKSLAAIGNDQNGNRWFAPTNWVNSQPSLIKDWTKIIDWLELVMSLKELNK
jgi:hypothetical protein